MRYGIIASKKASRIVLGGDCFGTFLSEEQSFEFMDTFFASGGTFIDTARVYGDYYRGVQGICEEVIGRWMSSRRCREKVVLSTKGGHPDLSDMHKGRLDRENLRRDLYMSLNALQTDHADVYFLHRDDPSRPVGDILETLEEFLQEGKIKCAGASNWTAARLREAEKYARLHGLRGLKADQPQFSLARQTAVFDDTMVQMDSDLYKFHTDIKMPCVCYSSQARGFFTKLERTGAEGLDAGTKARCYCEENILIFDKLKKMSEKTRTPVGALAIAYLLALPFDVYPIIGSRNTEQLRENLSYADASVTLEAALSLRDPA